MPKIDYTSFEEHTRAAAAEGFFPVYLIFGESFLYQRTLQKLLEALLQGQPQPLNYESLEGSNDQIAVALTYLNTYALLSGPKVVVLRDAEVFYRRQDDPRLMLKAQKAFEAGEIKQAARFLVRFLALREMTLDDISAGDGRNALDPSLEERDNARWLNELLQYCRDQGAKVPRQKAAGGQLQEAITRGFPAGHHLIITTDRVDKRRTLFKTIQDRGLVVDCSVPLGDRKADRQTQASVLKTHLTEVLQQRHKQMSPRAYQALYAKTGFDLPVFMQNVSKLIDFVGQRSEITEKDVAQVLERSKTDPIYAFTNALADRDLAQALLYARSLLNNNFHPLQILSAAVNQLRRLLLAKTFVQSSAGNPWRPAMHFNQFQHKVMPAVQQYDQELVDLVTQWDEDLKPSTASRISTPSRGQNKRQRSTTDTVIAKNPRNAYPIYQLLLKTENYSQEELVGALNHLSRADRRLKTSTHDNQVILEEVCWRICERSADVI